MTEVLFYHLERTGLEAVLPGLLEKCGERGWRAVVRAGSGERIEALDSLLWTYRDESFLAHGRDGDPMPDRQPVWLTTTTETPNAADVLFVVDRGGPGDLSPFERVVMIFDGRDDEATEVARGFWKQAREAGHDTTYWQQGERGGWERKA